MIRSPLVFLAAILLCSGEVRCEEVTAVCRPLAEPIRLAATEHRVPVLLLTALVFAESSCDASAVNAKGATGLGQILTTGAGEGYTQVELMDPWLNLQIASKHLAKWKHRCGTWLGAVTVYHGNARCSAKSGYARGVIRIWKRLERMAAPRA
jgi:soluble lytic murein transglycosylase-like protein